MEGGQESDRRRKAYAMVLMRKACITILALPFKWILLGSRTLQRDSGARGSRVTPLASPSGLGAELQFKLGDLEEHFEFW